MPKALVEAKTEKPLGLFSLMAKATNADTRRILGISIRVVESLGRDLGKEAPQ